ncbi:hypothetical protein HYH03_014916 [Edaphochlamys debaryana]|uniref:Steroid 5-alpha reductase C-terminal domain-containing protein n=1 Tax=Edaphochlamys debaryana TaxID=47281 RepID=A0A835XV90_9CHLO|nr:hypothetical protein HYH03_014916 [Edaphochlamys debaryana]|eukprot:KAG2486469.1 hypothetical protein HYH03_014916 [Edaphochlamys debaryana]
MAFRALCLGDAPGLAEALAATRQLGGILAGLPRDPLGAARQVAAAESPLVLAEALALACALGCWLAYLATRNCSHVDRMWSVLPPIYVAIFARRDLAAAAAALAAGAREAAAAGAGPRAAASLLAARLGGSGADPRLLLAAGLSAAWGCRLTYNFARRGGYRLSFEDHRWADVRKLFSPALFEVFSLVFVACAQHLLCLLITAPALVAATAPRQPLGPGGWAAASAFAALLAGEAAADNQQWAFQRRKHQLLAARAPRTGDYRRGFRTTGLFRFSRHPNFFCEYGMWWAMYVLCAALPSHCGLSWAAVGPVGLTLLFHGGSLWITEKISAAKYPAYRRYQRTTSAIVPLWPGPALEDERGD